MSKFYFYCPNCGLEKEVTKLPRGTVGNTRNGFGVPIHHFECEKCQNSYAGFMQEILGNSDEKLYYRDVIELYQILE